MSFLKICLRLLYGDNYGVLAYLKHNLKPNNSDDSHVRDVVFSSISYSLVIPFDYGKTFLQLSGEDTKLLSVLKQSIEKGGLFCFWSRLSFGSALLNGINDGAAFLLFSKLKPLVVEHNIFLHPFDKVLCPFIAGAASGVAVSLFLYPFDILFSLIGKSNSALPISSINTIFSYAWASRTVSYFWLYRGMVFALDSLVKEFCSRNNVLAKYFPTYTERCVRNGVNPSIILTYPVVALSAYVLYPIETKRIRCISAVSGGVSVSDELLSRGLSRGRSVSLLLSLSSSVLVSVMSEGSNIWTKRVEEKKILRQGKEDILLKEYCECVYSMA